jgi:hypothetical protein
MKPIEVNYQIIDNMTEEQKTKILKEIYRICQYIVNFEERFSDDHEETALWINEVFNGKEPDVRGI